MYIVYVYNIVFINNLKIIKYYHYIIKYDDNCVIKKSG